MKTNLKFTQQIHILFLRFVAKFACNCDSGSLEMTSKRRLMRALSANSSYPNRPLKLLGNVGCIEKVRKKSSIPRLRNIGAFIWRVQVTDGLMAAMRGGGRGRQLCGGQGYPGINPLRATPHSHSLSDVRSHIGCVAMFPSNSYLFSLFKSIVSSISVPQVNDSNLTWGSIGWPLPFHPSLPQHSPHRLLAPSHLSPPHCHAVTRTTDKNLSLCGRAKFFRPGGKLASMD